MRFTQAPPVIQPGRNVTLYQENGVVRYYAVENDAVVIAQQASAVAETQKVAVADVQDLHNKVDLMQSTLANKGKQLSELQVQLDTQKTAVGDVQSLQSRVEQLQANLVEKDKLLSALQTQADTQKTAVAGVDSLRSQVEQLQSTVSDKDKQLNDLQVQVKTLSDRPAAGTGKIDQANKRIADLEKELESLRSFRLQVTEFMSKNPPTRLGGGGVIPK
jgi:chromosome segregation ATPase